MRPIDEPPPPGTPRDPTLPEILSFPNPHSKTEQRRGFAKRPLLITAILLGVAAGAGVAWLASSGREVEYVTAPATKGPVARTVTATGTVNPVLTIIVGSYVSGVIQQLYCDYNTQVKKEQICAKIDPRPYQTVVDQDKANLSIARAQLEKDSANLIYEKLKYDRNLKLAETNAVSKDAADSAKSLYEQAQAQIEFAQATITQRQAGLDAARINLDYTNIVSPVDGTVVSRNVTMGQTVAASFQTPTLFLIATDLTTMQVDTNVSESDIGGVQEGNKTTFTVDAFPKRTFNGQVSQVRQSPQTVQNVVTYDVVISVGNSDLALKPGMTAATRIVTDSREDVVRVPNQALRFRPGGLAATGSGTVGEGRAQVWVLRQGQPVAVSVVLGLDDDNFTEIAGGDLKPNDQVITGEQSGGTGNRSAVLRLRLGG